MSLSPTPCQRDAVRRLRFASTPSFWEYHRSTIHFLYTHQKPPTISNLSSTSKPSPIAPMRAVHLLSAASNGGNGFVAHPYVLRTQQHGDARTQTARRANRT